MRGSLGEIRLWPVASVPNDWIACNGQLLSISSNQELFELLGTTYGGDGVNNFALPNLTPAASQPGSAPVQYILCFSGVWPLEGGMEGFYGEIRLWPAALLPQGWRECNGANLPIVGNQPLFSVLANYGSNQTTFTLPTVPPQGSVRYILCTSGLYPAPSGDFSSTGADTYFCEIRLWAGSFEPAGFALLDQARFNRYPVQVDPGYQVTVLYSLLGNNFGGTFPLFQYPQLDPLQAGFGSTVSYIMAIDGAFPDFP